MLIAAVFPLGHALFISQRKRLHTPIVCVIQQTLTYALVSTSCITILCALCIIDVSVVPEHYGVDHKSYFWLIGAPSISCSLIALGLIMLTAIGRLFKFRELLVTSIFTMPPIVMFLTLCMLSVPEDTAIAVPLTFFAVLFAYQLWIQWREPNTTRLSKIMLIYTEIAGCLFAYVSTLAVVLYVLSSLSELDFYIALYPFLLLVWSMLSLLFILFSRASARVTFRIVALAAFAVILTIGVVFTLYHADDLNNMWTLCLLSSAVCGIFAGTLLVRDRVTRAFIPWGNDLRIASAVFLVIVVVLTIAK